MRFATFIALSLLVGCSTDDPTPDVDLAGDDKVDVEQLEQELQMLIDQARDAEDRIAELENRVTWEWATEEVSCTVGTVDAPEASIPASATAWSCFTNEDGLKTCQPITDYLTWNSDGESQWWDANCSDANTLVITFQQEASK